MKEEMRTFDTSAPVRQTVMGTRLALEDPTPRWSACGKCACPEGGVRRDRVPHCPLRHLRGRPMRGPLPAGAGAPGATALGARQDAALAALSARTVEKKPADLAVLAEKEHQQQEDGEEAFVDNVIMYDPV